MERTRFAIESQKIAEVKLITPFYTEDERGFFLKSFEKDIFSEFGLENVISEDFESYSKHGVIRGMHFQTKNPQIKLVRAVSGIVHDIVVDIRKNSPTFGKYVDVILSDQNHLALWIPKGFAHGFEVISEGALMSYKCIGKYESGYDTGIFWNDSDLQLPWMSSSPIISSRDRELPSLSEFVEETNGGI